MNNTHYQVVKIDKRAFTLFLSEDGIFRCHMKEFIEINMGDTKQLVEAMGILGKG